MTREDLFAAIGQVEEQRLARCEEAPPSGIVQWEGDEMENKTTKRVPGRLLRSVLVAAVVVALLAATAIAAPVAYEGITGAWRTEEWEFLAPTDGNGDSLAYTQQDFVVEIRLDEDAPEEIETCYLPRMPEGYTQSFGYIYGGIEEIRRVRMQCNWSDDTAINAVNFIQVSKAYWERGNETTVHVYGDTAEVCRTELGGVEGLLISVPDDPLYPKKHFYWENGESVFHMIFAWHISQEEMAQILSSVHAVEDIRPYMISCDDEAYLDEILSK